MLIEVVVSNIYIYIYFFLNVDLGTRGFDPNLTHICFDRVEATN